MADLDDAALWRCVDATVHDVLLPALPADQQWARAVAVQLVGLARYAASRPADTSDLRAAEAAAVLETLGDNPLVRWSGDHQAGPVMEAAGAALAAAIGRDDDAAAEIRALLRPVLLRQLDDQLTVTAPLVDAFRGNLDG
jgi:hypothetical protein